MNPDEQNVNEIYYMVELAMEDFIYYEEISKFGRVYQTGSNDTGRNKEIFEAMRTLDKKTKERAGERVSGGKKPQLSIDKLKQYS